MTATLTRRDALTVATGLTTTALLVAAVVRLLCPAAARQLLAFPFAGIPATPGSALAIFADNARLLAAVFAAILVAQAPWLADRNARRGPATTLLVATLDTILALALAANVLLVGAALGAYGARMAAAMLPHGPLELGTYATALALLVRAHRAPLAVGHMLAVGAGCVAGLALGAMLETFIAL